MRWLLRRAAATVALWEDSEDALRRIGGRDISVRIIPTGAPARLFPPVDTKARRDARRALGLAPPGILAVYIGSLSSEKNVDAAVNAVAAIPDAELLVVGDGPDRARLESLAREAAPGRIRFLGSRERPRDVLAAGDVLVLPSKTEGIPAVLIEAGFSEIPVVASAVGGIPQMLGQGEAGVLVPPGDAGALAAGIVEAVAASKGLGRAGRRRSLERYEIGVVADAWDELLGGLGAWGGPR
jgi:glycosyltransferase involved in cell wall biosynthesis